MSDAREPAFPTKHFDNMLREVPAGHYGLTKREAFAMAALAGLCANMTSERFLEMSTQHMAALSIAYADSLCAELDRTKP